MRHGPDPEDDEVVHVRPDDLDRWETELELVADIWAADARAARHAAERAAAISRLARRRRKALDGVFGSRGGPGVDSRQLGHPALADYSELLVPEVALIRHCSEREAEVLVVESLTLTTTLTGTWSALYEGRIDEKKMKALVDLLGGVAQETAAEIERLVLPDAERRTVADLRAKVRRLLARLDAEALEKRRALAAKAADVRRYAIGDGMSRLAVDMSTPDAAACHDAIDQYARMMRADGDQRPMGVLRSAVARDLILRPWGAHPAVTAHLTVHASTETVERDGVDPAEVNGEVVSAAQCRELLERLDMLGVRGVPVGGGVHVAISDSSTGRLVAVATRRELRRGAHGSRRRRRRNGSNQPVTGSGLRPPGPTDCWNLCCLCRRHHRIKTFARGWSFMLLPDGRLVGRTPSGVSRLTWPPGWWHGAVPDPPELEEEAPQDPART